MWTLNLIFNNTPNHIKCMNSSNSDEFCGFRLLAMSEILTITWISHQNPSSDERRENISPFLTIVKNHQSFFFSVTHEILYLILSHVEASFFI